MSMLKQNNVKIVLSSKSWVIERSSEFDYRSFVNRTFDCVRLAKFYFEFDYVRLSSAIDWSSIGFDYRTVRLDTPVACVAAGRVTKFPV